MNTLYRNCFYQGKNLFRDYGFSFWSLLYPLILSLFFYMTFNGIMNIELKKIDIAVENESRIIPVLREIDIFNVQEVSKEQAINKLEHDEIDGFVEKNLNLMVNKSGINQTIIKEVIEQINQIEGLNRPIRNQYFYIDYISSKNQKSNAIVVTFYSLIAMVSTYSVFAGIMVVNFVQANLSSVGARINITPLKRSSFLIAGVIVALALNLFANAILLLFIKYILKVQLFTEFKLSCVFIILGNLFGVALGMFIGASNKKGHSTKILIAVALTLTMAFFSGMMGHHIKIMLDGKIPILGKLNPISIITNNLYRINLLENANSAGVGIVILLMYSIMLMLASSLFLRGRNYDSV